MAVYKALQNMDNPPKILAPETMSVDFTQIKRYMEPVIEQAPDSFYGIAHHLYAGADASNPNSYMTNMFTIKKLYPQYAKWQTEYYIGDAFTTAWLIHNSLVYEELNAYLYWDGAWAVHEDGERGFLNFENPFDQANWKSEKGYYIGEKYYAIRHYSEFIRPGYKRIDVAPTGARELLVSAYASPSQDKIAAVILNTSDKDMYIQLNFSSYHVLDSNLYVSSCKESHTMDDLFVDGGKLSDKQTLTIPAKGIVTVDITGEPSNNIQTQTDNNTVTTDTNNNEKEDIVVITNQSTAVPGIPSLDGKYDSIWDKASSQNLKVLAVGIEGASANFKTLWSDQYLYVHVGVKDKTTDTSAEDFADKDGVEFFMNESNTKPSSYSDGDAYYIVSRDNETSFGTGADKTNFKSITYETEDGYVVEAAIPLTTMKGEIGVKVGFDLQVNDSQGKGKSEYIIKWNDTSLLTTENLDRIGEVLFQ